jgi:hypothetical protein
MLEMTFQQQIVISGNPSVTHTNFPEFDRDAGENLIAESSDR